MPEYEDVLDLTPSPRLLEVLGDLDIAPWQCLAELADNCFDEFHSDTERDSLDPPTINITLPTERHSLLDASVTVEDNGRGMSKAELEWSLKAGYSGNDRYGHLGLFGMGFNIATARLGNKTEVWTTRVGDRHWLAVTIDLHDMQRQQSFAVPVRYEIKDDVSLHGTRVAITELRGDILNRIKRSASKNDIREVLGDVYSFMLREPSVVPFAGAAAKSVRVRLNVNGQQVKPRIPCVWSPERSVVTRGAEVPAVITINHVLPPAWACLECGKWFHVEQTPCTNCGSEKIEERERRVWGWLGVQRFLDRTKFGVDFIRQGRKILRQDKSVFTWNDPDGDAVELEYPVELPSGQGRIVGEIHLDHVEVSYRKDDFDRTSGDWKRAVNAIRGVGPMKPQLAREHGYTEPNESPLARLFTAFRRNDAGLRCLIPGDTQGNGPIHEKSREWGQKFRSGEPDFKTDAVWWEAARAYERAVGRLVEDPETQALDESVRRAFIDAGLGDPFVGVADAGQADADTSTDDATESVEPDDPEDPVETEHQRFERYKAASSLLVEISGGIALAGTPALTLHCYLTAGQHLLRDGLRVPSLARMPIGGVIEAYVDKDHSLFREFGRDPRDFALLEVASVVKAQQSSNVPLVNLVSDLLANFPDQRLTEAALKEQAEDLLEAIREKLEGFVTTEPVLFWDALSGSDKEDAMQVALIANPSIDWVGRASTDGTYSRYLTFGGVATLVRELPDRVFDGRVFLSSYGGWPDAGAQRQIVERLSGDLEALDLFATRGVGTDRDQLVRIQLTERFVRHQLAEG